MLYSARFLIILPVMFGAVSLQAQEPMLTSPEASRTTELYKHLTTIIETPPTKGTIVRRLIDGVVLAAGTIIFVSASALNTRWRFVPAIYFGLHALYRWKTFLSPIKELAITEDEIIEMDLNKEDEQIMHCAWKDLAHIDPSNVVIEAEFALADIIMLTTALLTTAIYIPPYHNQAAALFLYIMAGSALMTGDLVWRIYRIENSSTETKIILMQKRLGIYNPPSL